MQIRNAVIITSEGEPVRMRADELSGFTGNVVFCRSRLPPHVREAVDWLLGESADAHSPVADSGRASMDSELVR